MLFGWSEFAESLVLLLCLLPLAGAVLVALVSRRGGSAVRQMVLVNVLLSCGLSVLMVLHMQTAGPQYQMVSVHRWLAEERLAEPQPSGQAVDRPAALHLRTIGPDIRLAVGVDGLSMWLIVLTSLLMVPAVLLGRKNERNQPALFYGSLLVFQSAATGLFAALDVVLFCFCFELTILPLCLLIGRWGGPQRRPVARRLFVSHLVGSLFVLLGLLGVVVTYWWMQNDALGTFPPMTFSIPQLLGGNDAAAGLVRLAATNQMAGYDWTQFGPWMFVLLLIGFLVRPGLFPFHTALPRVVREAPAVARVLLVGIVPLFSLYGCARFLLPLFPAQCAELGGMISAIAIIGLVFTGLLALAETDAVKRITLAAVGLFELALAGLFSQTAVGMTGGLVQMLSAGLSVGLLLLLFEVDDRSGPIDAVAEKPGPSQPRRRALLLFAMLALIGAPGLSGFSGATISLLGIFQQSGWLAISALLGLLIVAWAVLRLWPTGLFPRDAISPDWVAGSEAKRMALKTQQGLHRGLPVGQPPPPAISPDQTAGDLTLRECAAVAPIVAAIIWIGINPQFITDRIEPVRGRVAGVESSSPQSLRPLGAALRRLRFDPSHPIDLSRRNTISPEWVAGSEAKRMALKIQHGLHRGLPVGQTPPPVAASVQSIRQAADHGLRAHSSRGRDAY